jgi:hypothetical protein
MSVPFVTNPVVEPVPSTLRGDFCRLRKGFKVEDPTALIAWLGRKLDLGTPLGHVLKLFGPQYTIADRRDKDLSSAKTSAHITYCLASEVTKYFMLDLRFAPAVDAEDVLVLSAVREEVRTPAADEVGTEY